MAALQEPPQKKNTGNGGELWEFKRAFEMAKRKLTDDLLSAAVDGAPYEWTGERHRLHIEVGGPGRPDWPLHVDETFTWQDDGILAELGSSGVRLAMRKVPSAGGSGCEQTIVLEISNIFSSGDASRFAESPKIGNALRDLWKATELMTSTLPGACHAWFEPHGALPAACVVTGRAALWPPVFAGFRAFAETIHAELLPKPTVPMASALMKTAVMYGAAGLARNPHLLRAAAAPPDLPLVVRALVMDRQNMPKYWPGKLYHLENLPDGRLPREIRGSALQIARVIPGIDRIPDGCHEIVKLWFDIAPRAIESARLFSDGKSPEDPTVELVRDIDGKRIKAVILRNEKTSRSVRIAADDFRSTLIQ